jgi:hypothetical protein
LNTMADFTAIGLDANTGTQATPVWTSVTGAGKEVRWSDLSTQNNVASASWPAMIRPTGSVITVDYTYAFTADATGNGFIGNAGAPPAFANTNYHFARWNWDNTGTFASQPIMTAYLDTNHNTPAARGGGGILAGHATDTGATAKSYFKANLYGQVTAPVAAPAAAPTATDGTVGTAGPAAGANWMANYQDLMADVDWITFPNTPTAVTAGTQECIFALFTGPNQTPALNVFKITLKYTWT